MMRGGLALTLVLWMLVGPAVANVTYRLESVGDAPLRSRFRPKELALLEKLNRRDVKHLGRAGRIIVPDRFDLDELDYSPFPRAWPGTETLPTALVVDQPGQAFGAYEFGRLVRWGPVSSGARNDPTPSGFFHLNWRSSWRRSTEDPEWILKWVYNFHSRRGLDLHEYAVPGTPASHACVRLLARDARWIFGWGRGWSVDVVGQPIPATGTPLIVSGSYDFGAPPPWLSPGWAAHGIALPPPPPPFPEMWPRPTATPRPAKRRPPSGR